MRILAVDDDPVTLDVLGVALEENGFDDITFAASAEDALELIEIAKVPYDVFLLDIMLPGTSGIEVCAKLRTLERYRSTPVIMITASRARDMMSRAFDAGATDFVSKPFDALELVTRIRLAALLNDSQQRERVNSAALEELGRLAEVSFDEPFDLQPRPCVKRFLSLENELLRRGDSRLDLTLFSVQMDNALEFYRGSRPAQFRAGIEAVSNALSDVIDAQNCYFAYAGRGTMFVAAHEGATLKQTDLQRGTNHALVKLWDSRATGMSITPIITARRIEGPEAWPGKMAADVMRSFQSRADLGSQADPFQVQGLFERLSFRIAGA
ncbi:response regulator [Sulfitobacter sp.]|uniref:response regulator n=1 Tax=Sulfitobacter sp. TaxID=1903071 RepID=UPI0030028F69